MQFWRKNKNDSATNSGIVIRDIQNSVLFVNAKDLSNLKFNELYSLAEKVISLQNELNLSQTRYYIESILLEVEQLKDSLDKTRLSIHLYKSLSRIYEVDGINRIKGGAIMDNLFEFSDKAKDYESAIIGLNHSAINQYNLLLLTSNVPEQLSLTLKKYKLLEQYIDEKKNKLEKEIYFNLKCNTEQCEGAVYLIAGHIEKAEQKLKNASEIANTIGEFSKIFPTLQHLAIYWLKKGNFSKSEFYFEKALDYYKYASLTHQAIFDKYLSIFYLKAGNSSMAINQINAAENLAIKLNLSEQLKHIGIIKKYSKNHHFLRDPFSINFLK